MILSKSVDDLFPPVKRAAEELLRRMQAKGLDIRVSSTYRDAEAQEELYAVGRAMPGLVVTNEKAGESAHNYRLAFDVYQNLEGERYNTAVLRTVGEEAERMGLSWGGGCPERFGMAHIQWLGGLTIAQLKSGEMPDDKQLEWEI